MHEKARVGSRAIGAGRVGMVDAKFASCRGGFLCRRHVQTINRNIQTLPICTPIEPFLSFLKLRPLASQLQVLAAQVGAETQTAFTAFPFLKSIDLTRFCSVCFYIRTTFSTAILARSNLELAVPILEALLLCDIPDLAGKEGNEIFISVTASWALVSKNEVTSMAYLSIFSSYIRFRTSCAS